MGSFTQVIIRKKKADGSEVVGEKWDSVSMFHDLCTTIRECWDADAEARLSAGLIESRVAEMAQVFKVTFLSFVRHIKSAL